MNAWPDAQDTIAAVSTAPGAGAVGVVRLSGERALEIADALFRGRRSPSRTPGGRFLHGHFVDAAGETLDEGLLLVFRAPRSYTGEHAAELQAHGAPAVLSRLLARACELGARPARPGEFTLRAYLNGRLDLAQAEAVLSLVNAGGEAARRQATLGLAGALGRRIEEIGARLTRSLSAIQALLDYPEEGVPEEDRDAPLAGAQRELEDLLASARAGRLAARGATLALIGRPNAGKSSLLNALVGFERSIVTPTPGTTRDYLEERGELAGVPVTFVDTAGLRDTRDPVEAAGVARARELAAGADVVLALEDGSRPREVLPGDLSPERTVRLRTKADLPAVWSAPAHLAVSAITGAGLPELRARVRALLLGDAASGEVWLSGERQMDAARRALAHVQAARALPDELAAFELEEGLRALAEISGRDVQGDVLDAVFANFCVGK